MKEIQWTKADSKPKVLQTEDRYGIKIKNGTTFELDEEYVESQGLSPQQVMLASYYLHQYKDKGRQAKAFLLDNGNVGMEVDGNKVFEIKPEGDVD